VTLPGVGAARSALEADLEGRREAAACVACEGDGVVGEESLAGLRSIRPSEPLPDCHEGVGRLPVSLRRDGQDLRFVVGELGDDHQRGRPIAFDVELNPAETLERDRKGHSLGSRDDETTIRHGEDGLGSARLHPELFARLQSAQEIGFEVWSGVHLAHLRITKRPLLRDCTEGGEPGFFSAPLIPWLRRCISRGIRRLHVFAMHDKAVEPGSRGSRKVRGVIMCA